MEELDFIIEASIEQMDNSIKFLEKELLNIRAGKANPNMLSSVKVDYYGSLTPLNQIANVNTPDSQTLSIQPWEKDKLEDIEKAIQNADIGLNPATDGDVIRIPIPSLSEERRQELSKVASKFTEDSKISIRSHRRNGIDDLEKTKDDISADEIKRFESQIQELTDKYVKKVDELLSVKQNELLEV